MRRGLTTVLSIAAVLAITSGAIGAVHHRGSPAQVARLTKQVSHLQAQLRGMKRARDTATASLVATAASLQSSQEQLGAADQQIAIQQGQMDNLQIQIGTLQHIVGDLQDQVTSLHGQVTSLQTQLDDIPAPSAVAVQQVQHEVAWAQSDNDPRSAGELTALSAMNYVAGHVSTAEYGYLEITGGTLPKANADSILGAQAGICGHASVAFATIMSELGYPVRSAQFYFDTPAGDPDSHIAVEVQYDGAWHFFDPTFGVYWTDTNGDVMSITDVRAGGGTEHKDDAAFTNVIEDPWFNGDDSAFLTDPATDFVIGAEPLP